MSKPDHYETLGIPSYATLEQIKAAYRRLALKHHPDKNPGVESADERFKLCNDAYAVLSDPKRRAAYDEERRGVPEIARGILDDLLGNRLRRKRDGKDLRLDLRIALTEVVQGVTKRVSYDVIAPCLACGERGAAPDGTTPCAACGGKGEVKDRPGLLSIARPCAHCGGQGVTIVKACKACGGVGTVEERREYTVKLPPGSKSGDVKIVAGGGEPGGGGGRPGDLHLVVEVAEHPLLTLQGNDLELELPLRFRVAVLGGTVDVPTLEGSVRMKVPAGTQSGRVFRLPKKGLPGADGARGDELVRILVETPVGLDSEAERLVVALDGRCGAETHPLQEAFRAKRRDPDR